MRGALLVLVIVAGSGRLAVADESALRASFVLGGQVGFGNTAERGTAPWAALWTTTSLSSSPTPWWLLTDTQLTAAPGSEFKLEGPESLDSLRALQFQLGLAIPLRKSWNFRFYLGGGIEAQVLDSGEPAESGKPTPRWVEAGVYVSSTARSWLKATVAVDERGGAWKPAFLVSGGYQVMSGPPALTMTGQARVAQDTRVVLGIGVGR